MGSLKRIIESFHERSSYFQRESSWSVDSTLNRICTELLLADVDEDISSVKILDYGAGPGSLSRKLAEYGLTVDVADICDRMLAMCNFARKRFLVPQDRIDGVYDRIILRQVLQYVEENRWNEFVLGLLSLLSDKGRLLFSQIVPYCRLDYDFWRDLVHTRRKERRSFPSENEFLQLCESLDVPIISFTTSYTRQSLRAWICEAPHELQQDIRRRFEQTTPPIWALWAIESQNNDDVMWRNRWVHILVGPPKAQKHEIFG